MCVQLVICSVEYCTCPIFSKMAFGRNFLVANIVQIVTSSCAYLWKEQIGRLHLLFCERYIVCKIPVDSMITIMVLCAPHVHVTIT